ncbi:MAG: hypothetical protein ABI977_32810 [Acidobacteriota bacterium]
MKNKLYFALTTLALTATLLFSALAQNNNAGSTHPPGEAKPQIQPKLKVEIKPTYLPCAGEAGGDVVSTVRVTNNTGATIPGQTLIYLQTSNGPDKEALSSALATRREVTLHAPKGNTPKSCQAWFFKN